MKTSLIPHLVFAAIVFTCPNLGYAQPTDAAKEIEKVIADFFNAISNRDASAVRQVLGDRFVGMDVVTEAGNKNARIEFVDTAEDKKLLPPEGNDDMVGLRVSSLNAQFSDSNPTVAIASFLASRPLTEKQLERFRKGLESLKDLPEDRTANEADRVRIIEKIVAERQIQFSMLAMLGRRNGEWKIICMAFPE